MKYAICFLITLFAVSCGSDSRGPASAKSRISDDEYNSLLSESSDKLVQRAQAGELGMCTVVRIQTHEHLTRCTGDETYAIVLSDTGYYFPNMDKDADHNVQCYQDLGDLLREALQSGSCYYNSIGPVK